MSGFGARLKSARRANRLSQSDLARIMGVSITTVKNIEKGHSWPRATKIGVLPKHLGVSAHWLVTGAEFSAKTGDVAGFCSSHNIQHVENIECKKPEPAAAPEKEGVMPRYTVDFEPEFLARYEGIEAASVQEAKEIALSLLHDEAHLHMVEDNFNIQVTREKERRDVSADSF